MPQGCKVFNLANLVVLQVQMSKLSMEVLQVVYTTDAVVIQVDNRHIMALCDWILKTNYVNRLHANRQNKLLNTVKILGNLGKKLS